MLLLMDPDNTTARSDSVVAELRLQMLEAAPDGRHPIGALFQFAHELMDPAQRRRFVRFAESLSQVARVER